MAFLKFIWDCIVSLFGGGSEIADRLKERRSATFVSNDEELQDDMEKSLEKQLGIDDNPADGTEPDNASDS